MALIFSVQGNLLSFSQVDAVEKEQTIKEDIENDAFAFPNKTDKKIELKQKRNDNQQTFLNPDGTITTEIYSQPVFWKDENGDWIKIENEVVEVDSLKNNKKEKSIFKSKDFKNKSNMFEARLKKDSQSDEFLTFSLNEHQISISPINALSSKVKTKNEQVIYQNIYKQTDFKYTYTSLGIKEDIILKDKTSPKQFQFKIDTNGLIPKIEKNVLNFYNDDGKLIIESTPFFAYDQNDVVNRNIKLSLDKEKSEDEFVLNIKLDEKWLQEEDRSFPIIVDPSINIQYMDIEVVETFAYEGSPNSSYYDFSYVRAGNNGYGNSKSFLKFQLPEIPSSALIQSAKLDLFSYGASNPSNNLQVFEVTNYWEETELTWNNQPNVVSKPFSDFLGGGSSTTFWMTELINSWYNGSKPNNGIMIQTKDTKANKHEFLTTENPNLTKNPKLTITYKIDPIGSEEYWTFDNNINLFNGNLFFKELDESLDGRGIPITVGRFYNSKLKDSEFELGKGWNLSLNDRLIYKEPGKNFIVKYSESDGTNHYFTYISGEWKAKNLGLELIYSEEEKTFSLIDESKTTYQFNSNGYMVNMIDSNGNTTSYIRNEENKVTKIIDPSGRYVDLSYNNTKGLLTDVSGNDILNVHYVYDLSNRLTEVQYRSSDTSILSKVRYEYNELNQIIGIYDNANNKKEIRYNGENKVIGIDEYVSQEGVKRKISTNYSYSASGTNLIVTKENAKNIITRYTFNDVGNLIKIEEDYNVSMNTSTRTTSLIWNMDNEITKVIDPKGNPIIYEYDGKNNITSITNSKGNKQLMKYDANNNLTQFTGFSGETTKDYYNKNNNKTDTIDSSSSSIIYNYDSYGNVISNTKQISISNNLVLNSGFESWGTSLPTSWVATKGQTGNITKSTTKKNGEYSVKLSSVISSQNASITSDYIPVEGNKTYSFAYQAKTSSYNSDGKFYGSVKWFASDYSTLLGETKLDDVKGYSEFTRRSKSLQSPENAVFARIVFQSKEINGKLDANVVVLRKGKFEKNAKDLPKNYILKQGVSEIFEQDGEFYFVVADVYFPEKTLDLEEAKQNVIYEYQQVFENQWTKDLKENAKIEINKPILNKLKAKYKQN